MKLLFAEDDRDLSRAVKLLLERSGYTVSAVTNGTDAADYLEGGDYDGAILDWMMPGLSGIEVLARVRRNGIAVPCLMLTARDSVSDRVSGLDAGADDYLPKPFDTAELLARVRAMLRRRAGYAPDLVRFGDLTLDRGTMALSRGTATVRLNNKAFQLMDMLMTDPGVVQPITRIMDSIWGWDSEADTSVVWVNISQLRKRLAELGSDVDIRATRGVGYSLECRTEKQP